MKYKIEIMSKYECTLYSTKELDMDCIIISINDTNSSTKIFNNDKIIDVLKLTFDDITIPINGLQLINTSHTKQIKEFIDKYKDSINNIIIHCTAGISRSGSVGCCIARYLNSEDDYLLSTGNYIPNKLVYELLCKELELSYSDELFEEKLKIRNSGKLKDLDNTFSDMFCDVIIN